MASRFVSYSLLAASMSLVGIYVALSKPLTAAIPVFMLAFLRFAIAKRARASNAIEGYGSSQTGGVREVRVLPAATLDGLLKDFPPPEVLKIDVEGAELMVLDGAASLLAETRPRIYCEVSEDTRRKVTQLLERHGYYAFDGVSFGSGVLREVGENTVNLVAIPGAAQPSTS